MVESKFYIFFILLGFIGVYFREYWVVRNFFVLFGMCKVFFILKYVVFRGNYFMGFRIF